MPAAPPRTEVSFSPREAREGEGAATQGVFHIDAAASASISSDSAKLPAAI